MAAHTTTDAAEIMMVEVGEGLKLMLRVWGSRSANALPVIFVHGGPGCSVADYKDNNAYMFEPGRYLVVEVDQRGTGQSTPSVRDGFKNMQCYFDISIDKMSADFEVVREHLKIDRWLVFGGSWGSTLALDYAQRYPERCSGLILRGIFLNTAPEFDAVYARKSFENDKPQSAHQLVEFDAFFEPAAKEASRRGEAVLDPDDPVRIVRLYESLILAGDREAIWRFYVFEMNLLEEDPAELLDPRQIDEAEYPKALSVSFFEARLFLRGTFEEPLDIMGRLPILAKGSKDGGGVFTWVVQGTGDPVCPAKFAIQLALGLEEAGVPYEAHLVHAGHRCSASGVKEQLKRCVDDFYSKNCS